jgi:quercetin dioxygenase-like cupin family protein
MILKEIKAQLETSTHPVAKVLHRNSNLKALAIGFNKGMMLKEHKVQLSARLYVLSGKIIYRQGEKSLTLSALEDTDIPLNVVHSVEALEDSLCLLIQG